MDYSSANNSILTLYTERIIFVYANIAGIVVVVCAIITSPPQIVNRMILFIYAINSCRSEIKRKYKHYFDIRRDTDAEFRTSKYTSADYYIQYNDIVACTANL